MTKRKWAVAGPWTAFVLYVAVALEVIVMITPFAAYFYSVYAPILGFLEARPATAWLTAFFLPHISASGDAVMTALAYVGPILLGLGLAIFLICAAQVYSAKLFKRGVVSGGLYASVRHPQYLGLAVAGLGLLLYWPRFIILILYVTMLLLYYVLARDEERRMEGRYGDGYRTYAARLPMFLPSTLGGRLIARLAGDSAMGVGAVGLVYGVGLVASVGVAAALRGYSESRLTTFERGRLVAVSLTGGERRMLERRVEAALADGEVQRLIGEHPPDHTLVAYALPQDYMMQHLIADLGEHEAHHGGGEGSGFLSTMKHLGEMYALRPLRQLRAGATASA